MMKVKSKREATNQTKHKKSVGKKSKKKSNHRVEATNVTSKVKSTKFRRSSSDVEPPGACTINAETMTAFEYYEQCRSNSPELNRQQIDSQMCGPISRKRMKVLQALKKRAKKSRRHNKTETKLNRGSSTSVLANDSDDEKTQLERISNELREQEDPPVDAVESDSNENVNIADPVASPEFFNSINSRQVLLLLRGKVFFHGALKIRLLAGQVCIFGYTMEQNESATVNSPRGHNFLYLSSKQRNPGEETADPTQQLKNHFRKLSKSFHRTDLANIESSFDSTTDAVVLLENDFSKSILMIENNMKEMVFPNVNTFFSSPFQQSESILRSQFLLRTKSGLKINPQWENISMTKDSRHVIIGGKGVGKSTFLRYFINSNLRKFKSILLIDLDIGQPEMFLPQTVSATVINEPILGPGYLRNKSPHKSFLFGDVNVLVSSIKYLQCVMKLVQHCHSIDEFKAMPWIVNTMGYSRGFGLELIVAILQTLKPSDVVQIESSQSLQNFEKILNADEVNNFRFNFFGEEVKEMDRDCTYTTHVCKSMSQLEQKRFWDITPKDLRFATILSKLGNILKGNAKYITDVKPLCTSLDDVKIVIVGDDSISTDMQPKAVDGNLVYLCHSATDDTDEILECYGLGIVRSVDTVNEKLYLLPSISTNELQHVNTLAICSIPLPTSILMNQGSKITRTIPFAYSSDNFIGSKQIVPISYRPDTQMSTTGTK